MASLLKKLTVFGTGCVAGYYLRDRVHFKEAFTIGNVTIYYPNKMKNDPTEETVFEKINKD